MVITGDKRAAACLSHMSRHRLAQAVLFTLAAFAAALAPTGASAQETGGAVSGTIIDPQKGALPGVSVTLRNESTNTELTTVANDQGAFVHPFVPIGRASRRSTSSTRRGSVRRIRT